MVMSSFAVNPAAQQLDPMAWVMIWYEHPFIFLFACVTCLFSCLSRMEYFSHSPMATCWFQFVSSWSVCFHIYISCSSSCRVVNRYQGATAAADAFAGAAGIRVLAQMVSRLVCLALQQCRPGRGTLEWLTLTVMMLSTFSLARFFTIVFILAQCVAHLPHFCLLFLKIFCHISAILQTQVSKWYSGWKTVFPPSLATHPRMETQWARGLDMLNAAMEGQPLAPIMQVCNPTWFVTQVRLFLCILF